MASLITRRLVAIVPLVFLFPASTLANLPGLKRPDFSNDRYLDIGEGLKRTERDWATRITTWDNGADGQEVQTTRNLPTRSSLEPP